MLLKFSYLQYEVIFLGASSLIYLKTFELNLHRLEKKLNCCMALRSNKFQTHSFFLPLFVPYIEMNDKKEGSFVFFPAKQMLSLSLNFIDAVV